MERDIRVEMKFQNNLILSRADKMGIKTISELSARSGISKGALYALVGMQKLPYTKEGRWSPSVIQLAGFFNCLPEDLFSEFQQTKVLDKNRAHAEIHFSEVQALLAGQRNSLIEPSNLLAAKELSAAIETALNSLSPRDAKVLRMRFGIGCPEMTLEEVSKVLGVTGARVKQIEGRAIRRIRDPDKSGYVRDLAFENDALDGDVIDTIEFT